MTASYCVFVRDGAAAFSITDSTGDDRLGDHPKRHEVHAYCGVPLIDEVGRVYGTICHFDLVPRAQPLGEDMVRLMQSMSSLLVKPPPR